MYPHHSLSVKESLEIIHQLELVMATHDVWLSTLFKSLICGTKLGDPFLKKDSFERCQFGSWLYGDLAKNLKKWSFWLDIEATHRRMHESALDLITYHASTPRNPATLDRMFEDLHLKRYIFRLLVNTLEKTICHSIFMIDPLTQTLTREKLIPTLDRELQEIQGTRKSSLIAMVDIDHFKAINDTHGHLVGDRVLSEVAKFLKYCLRPTDLIFR